MSKLKTLSHKKNYDVVIIGGGVGGCATAIKLAATKIHGRYLRVALIEKRELLLQATSKNTPGRMGLGFHYFPSSTAKMYLQNTINFMREYPGTVIGGGEKEDDYLRKGRYFIVKDSLVPAKELLEYYDNLKNAYAFLVKEDPANKIFGEPENFYRRLRPHEYKEDINNRIVTAAIETQEQLLDYNLFLPRFTERVNSNTNIDVICRANVSEITQETNRNYVVNFSRDGQERQIDSHIIVNATWENIENLNKSSGVESPANQTNRLKLLAEVRLPKDLQKSHSMFFCIGPHAMFSNLGNGLARITYAPVTNHEINTDLPISNVAKKWLSEGLTNEQKQNFGNEIIKGVAKYIPKMKDAKLINVFAGIVKTQGGVELHNRMSAFHERNYSGVFRRQLGWIDNACIKLTYCENNANEVVHLVKDDIPFIMKEKSLKALSSQSFLKAT